jgi:hypothetical protein
MELEKALLVGEEKALENQINVDKNQLEGLNASLKQIDDYSRLWKIQSLESISEVKGKLKCSEKELQRLEKMHEDFCGTADEETVLLERLKFQHELVESDKKVNC